MSSNVVERYCSTNQKYFIVEGANASGKTTLVSGLKRNCKNLTTVTSIPEEYNNIRSLAYNKLSDVASLFLYLSGNIELLERVKKENGFVVFDRSLISSFSIYLSRQPEREWNSIIPLYKMALNFMPKISKIFHLTILEEERERRIDLKSGKEKEADLIEIEWEAKKNLARKFLLSQTDITIVEIDTSNLSIVDVLNKVRSVIDKDRKSS